MDKVELERRTKEFALSIVADVLGYQVLKSGTSIGANYREANRAESHDDFIHKIGIVEKEASESEYWLELLEKSHICGAENIGKLLRECRELIAIFTAIGKTAKARRTLRSRRARNSQFEIHNPK